MESMQILCKTAIPGQCGSKYKGIAFDGCHFILTCPELSQIVKYDKFFCEVERFDTLKPYLCICYDSNEDCFWASCSKCGDKLYKLDSCFNEIDYITVRPCEGCGVGITGISYDCSCGKLLVSFPNCITSIDTSECEDEIILQKSRTISNMGVLSISPSYINIEMHNAKQYISVYSSDCTLVYVCDIPNTFFVESIIFNACFPCCDEKLHLYILATKNSCYSYILDCVLDCCNLEICDCNYRLYEKDCCEPSYPISINSCNDLIESIALLETALAHILNAEGEKLQKAIACSDCVEEILCINESIQETIIEITHLEIVLHDKLSVIKDCGCIDNCDCN